MSILRFSEDSEDFENSVGILRIRSIAGYASIGNLFEGLGGPRGSQNGGFLKVWGSTGVPKSVSGAFGGRW